MRGALRTGAEGSAYIRVDGCTLQQLVCWTRLVGSRAKLPQGISGDVGPSAIS
jgi:hypothetical protein